MAASRRAAAALALLCLAALATSAVQAAAPPLVANLTVTLTAALNTDSPTTPRTIGTNLGARAARRSGPLRARRARGVK